MDTQAAVSDSDKPRGYSAAIVAMVVLIGVSLLTAAQRAVPVHGERQMHREGAWPDMRINVNAATAAELSLLPGLGTRLSERIVVHRETHGPFQSIDGLRDVSGIGPMIIERIRPFALATELHVDSAITSAH